MLTDKAKNFEADTTSFSPAHPSSEPMAASSERKPNNVLPLERPKYTTGKLKLAETPRIAANENLPETAQDTETGEIKSRIEAVLARMKSRAANADSPDSVAGETADSGPLAEELERRRAAIISIAREAEVRARETADTFRQAEHKLKEAEARLKEETELRLLAEQRVIRIEEQSRQIEEQFRQIEEEVKLWLDTAQAEEARRIEAEKAKAELEIRLKQEAEARLLAEELRAEAEGKVKAAGQALANAQQAAKEAEAKVHSAEEAARAAESLIYEADAIARQAEEKCHAAEANLQREVELRSLAEQMLKELASVNPQLELNWEYLEAALAQAVSTPAGTPAFAPPSGGDHAALQQLQTQIEAEQKSRIAAEQARAEAEAKAQELETKLRKSEDKYRTTESGYKKVLRKQEEELRAMSEQVVRNNDSGQAIATINPENDQLFLDITEPGTMGAKLKLVSYGVFITLLVLALIWLGFASFRQL